MSLSGLCTGLTLGTPLEGRIDPERAFEIGPMNGRKHDKAVFCSRRSLCQERTHGVAATIYV